jgi:hypothetical protein
MRQRRWPCLAGRTFLLGTAAALWLACGGGAELTAPSTGAVEVTTSTAGEEPDPDGYTLTLDDVEAQPIGTGATATVAGLTPGSHLIGLAGVSPNCTVEGNNPRSVTVVAGETVVEAIAVVCAEAPPSTGGVTVTTATSGVSPDPDGYSVTVDGDEGRPIGVDGSVSVSGLSAGDHLVGLAGIAANCTVAGDNPRAVTVPAGDVAALDFSIECGAPPVTTGTVTVTTVTSGPSPDPDGYAFRVGGGADQPIGASATVSVANVAAGATTVELSGVASNCAVGGENPRPLTVPAGGTVEAGFTITCGATTGSLAVTIAGLPAGASAAVTVTGPSGYLERLTATRTLGGLAPGQYTVSAASVSNGGATYTSSPENRSVTVAAGAAAAVTVTYAVVSAPSLNLWIPGLYLTQSVQTFKNEVPLVAGRDAFLRVFVRASESNTAAPAVRVRLYQGASLIETFTITAPGGAVPTVRDEGTLTASWNTPVPGSLIRPGLAVLADLDPGNGIDEANETDNSFPVTGVRSPVSVRAVPPLAIRLIPVRQSANQLQGDVTTGNTDQYLDLTRRIYPLPGYDADLHAVYTTTTPDPLQSDDANGAWNTVLSEINALRVTEGTDRHYYGVVRTGFASGLVGRGFIGLPAAIGYDDPGDRGRITAHELGHTWDRLHAPCGNPQGQDSQYPNPDGSIGSYGYDVENRVLKRPELPDLMGYCGNPWISAYTYQGVMDFRGTQLGIASAGRPQSSLLVWGRIVGGRAVLEPAFRIVTRPALPRRPGPYSIEGTASDGSRVFGLSFDAIEVADDDRGSRHFAFAVPLDELAASRLESIRLAGPGVGMASVSRPPASLRAAPAEPISLLRSAGGVGLRWDPAAHPMIMVRDTRTGEVLSFARGGNVMVPARGDVELVTSDGVWSRSATVAAPR